MTGFATLALCDTGAWRWVAGLGGPGSDDAFGPRSRASHRAAARLGLSASIAIAEAF